MACRQAAYVWLGAGAIALGMGAAFATGSGTAHADSTADTSSTAGTSSTSSTAGTSSAAAAPSTDTATTTTTGHRKHRSIAHVTLHRAQPVKTRTSRKIAAAQSVSASSTVDNPAATEAAEISQQSVAINAERHAFGTDLRAVQQGPAHIPHLSASQLLTAPAAQSLLHASATFNHLAAELESTAIHVQAAATMFHAWNSPVGNALAYAATPYVGWLSAAARQAETAATQALATGSAFEAAFAANVPPPVIAANRAQLAALAAVNVFGGNLPAIVATEAMYLEMWAQDIAGMLPHHRTTAA